MTYNGVDLVDGLADFIDGLDRENEALRIENSGLREAIARRSAATPAPAVLPADLANPIDRARAYQLVDKDETKAASLSHAREVARSVTKIASVQHVIRNEQGLITRIVKEVGGLAGIE